MRKLGKRCLRLGEMLARNGAVLLAALALSVSPTGALRADDFVSALRAQPSLMDTPDGPKEQLRRVGVTTDVWVTQFYQGVTSGDGATVSRYGGKMDAFLKVNAEKLGLWSGLHLNAQYEHYFGDNINRKDFALIPVNAALAYVERDGYHSALSLSVTQDLGERFSVSAGKFNMMTLASRTPLIGGGGIDTFMNRAFALPSTGVACRLHSAWRARRRPRRPFGALSHRRDRRDQNGRRSVSLLQPRPDAMAAPLG